MSSDVEPVPEGAVPSTGRSPRRSLLLGLALAALVAAVAGGLGLRLGGGGGDGEETELRAAAGRFAEAFLTYDHTDPERHRDTVLELSTGSFREEYGDAFDQGLGQVIARVQASSQGFVKDVFVGAVDDDGAQAVVVADVTRDGTGGPRTIYDLYFRLSFVRVDGTWKVDQVTDLNFDTGAAGDTTATTAPSGAASSTIPVP